MTSTRSERTGNPLGGHRLTLLIIAALAVVLLLFRDELPSLDLEQLIEDVSASLGQWTYLLVGGLAFLETGAFVGLVAPGEFTVILGGAVAGQGDISLPLILAITWFSAWAGDSVSFLLGHRLGRGFLVRHGPRFRIDEKRLKQVEDYFDRHGGKTILVGRFIGLVRALAPFIAGTSHMRYSAFLPYSVLGTGIWATGLILVGYFFSRSLDEVTNIVGTGLVVFGFTVGTIVVIVLTYRWLREPDNQRRLAAEMEKRPALRPLLAFARRVRPQAEFLWNRVTPGGLGLELTSLLAVLAVGLFVLVSYASIVNGDPGPTGGDGTVMRIAEDIRTGWLIDVAKAITELGAAYVVLPLVGVAAIALAARGHWIEVSVLVAGMLITVVAADVLKETIERPRPAGGLTDASGDAFPSAHASYSTIYVWLAATVALRLTPGLTARTALITGGVVLAALVGLTRVYLNVHYMSDVSAGWGLGLAAFALCGAVAVVLVHIRKNVAPDEDRDGPRLGHI